MPQFNLNIKSHGEYPDTEDTIRAVTATEAAQALADKHDMDVADVIANLEEVEDQPAEYGDDGQGNYN